MQDNAPYATITISGDQIPDNRYYELDVTKLIQEYANGKSENTTGFIIKAREKDKNYIAFYSSTWKNTSKRPKLSVEYT